MTELAQIVAVLRKLAEIQVFKCGERFHLRITEKKTYVSCMKLSVDINTFKENIKVTVTHIQDEIQ